MIVVDTSAVVAILAREPEEAEFAAIIGQAEERLMFVASVLELTMVFSSRMTEPVAGIENFLNEYSVKVEPVDLDQLGAAQQAFLAYGKGRHPASLNFGDCLAYALAKTQRAPLLYKGNDFVRTDIRPAA